MRQLFDEHARHEQHRKHSNRHSSSQLYSDAKHSSVDENIFGPSSLTSGLGARNLDFERAKQKFDRPNNSSSRNPKKARNFSSFLKFSNKKSDPSPVDNEVYSSPRTSQYMEDDVNQMKLNNCDDATDRKKNAYMNSSMNLDGLKVSEDDDDVSRRVTGMSKLSQFV